MFFTPDRLLVLALAVTLLGADGIRRLWKQAKEGDLEPRAFRIMTSMLVAGLLLSWVGVVLAWLRMD
jgi:hypothetical protein